MEQESDLQFSTERFLGIDRGPHAEDLDRILRDQQTRLDANVTLLEKSYAMLPCPTRFRALHGRLRPPATARRVAPAPAILDLLRNLVAQHLGLLGNLDQLIAQHRAGPGDPLLLSEVAHNHEVMAWILTALIKEDESTRDSLPVLVTATAEALPVPAPSKTESIWENEGGAIRRRPAGRDRAPFTQG